MVQPSVYFSDFLGTLGFAELKSSVENLLLPLRTKFSSDTKKFEFVGSLLAPDELELDPDHRTVSTALLGLTQNLVTLILKNINRCWKFGLLKSSSISSTIKIF